MQPDPEKLRQTRAWLATARDDLASAERLGQPPPAARTVVYLCQQAVEKALKGFLLWNDTPFARTHDLRELVRQCETIDASFRALMPIAEVLNPYVTQFRYPSIAGPQEPTLHEMQDALRHALAVVRFVEHRLP